MSFCTHYQNDGSLLVGAGKGIMLYKDDYSKPQQILSTLITSVVKNMGKEEGYFFISHKDNLRTVSLTTDFIGMTDQFKLEYKGTRGTFLAATAEVIAAIAHKWIKL